MILVITGTHHQPFDRLVRAAARLAEAGERVVVQVGASQEPAPGCEVHQMVPPDALAGLAREARVVICHAGPGSVRLAMEAGHVPIVVPRDPAHGEHVDGHQLAWAERVASAVHLVRDPATLSEAVLRHAAEALTRRGRPIPGLPNDAMAQRLGALVEALVASRDRAPRSRRASLCAVFHLFGRGR